MQRRKKEMIRLLQQSGYGDYTYEEGLGTGSAGEVHKVVKNGIPYALKLPRVDIDPAVKAKVHGIIRLERQRLATPQFRDLAIVQFHDTLDLRVDGAIIPGFTMECLDGTLEGQFALGKRYTAVEAIDLLLPLLEPLVVLHEVIGVTHNDIWPANIFLAANGHAKLADLGIARKLRQSTETVRGKPAYVPPELNPANPNTSADGRFHLKANPSSDIYAFICTLYHMITATPLLQGDFVQTYPQSQDVAILRYNIQQEIGTVGDQRYDPLRAVMQQAVHPNSAERFIDVKPFAIALREARKTLEPRAVSISGVVEQLERRSSGTDSGPFSAPTAEALAEALRGKLRERVGKAAEELAILVRQVYEHPDDVKSHHTLGRFMVGIADFDPELLEPALSEFDAAIRLDKGHAAAHDGRATVLRYLGGRRGDEQLKREAIASARQAIALETQNSDFHENLGMGYRITRQFLQAQQAYERARELNPSKPTLATRFASLYEGRGDEEHAIAGYQHAIVMLRDSRLVYELAYVHVRLGQLHGKRKEYAEAISQLTAAVETDIDFMLRVCGAFRRMPQQHRSTTEGQQLQTILNVLGEELTAHQRTLEDTVSGISFKSQPGEPRA